MNQSEMIRCIKCDGVEFGTKEFSLLLKSWKRCKLRFFAVSRPTGESTKFGGWKRTFERRNGFLGGSAILP